MPETIFLKWGTLKGWDGLVKDSETWKALKKYLSEETSMSAMEQQDSDSQKQALLEAIDACDMIYNDWEDCYLSKQEAREYILNYGN